MSDTPPDLSLLLGASTPQPKQEKFTDVEWSVFEFLDRYAPFQNNNTTITHALRMVAFHRGNELLTLSSLKGIPRVIYHEIASFLLGRKDFKIMFVTTLLRHWQYHGNLSYLIWIFSWFEAILLACFLGMCFHYDLSDESLLFYHRSSSICLLFIIVCRSLWSVYRCLMGLNYAMELRNIKSSFEFEQTAPIELYSDIICLNNISARHLETICELFESSRFCWSFVGWILARNFFEFFVVVGLGFGSNFYVWFCGTYGSFLAFVGSFYMSIKTRFNTLLWPVICFMLGEHMLSTMQLFDLLSRTMVSAGPTNTDFASWASIHESFWMSAHFLIFIIGFILTILCHFAFFIWPVHVQKGAIFFILFWDGMMGANTCLVLGRKTLAWGCFVFGAVLHLHIAIQFLVEGIPIFWIFPDDEVVIIDPDKLTLTQWIMSRYRMFFCYNARCRAAVTVPLGDNDSSMQFRL